MLFVRAYPRETQEMVFDAHDRAFALFDETVTATFTEGASQKSYSAGLRDKTGTPAVHRDAE
jgi:hypothetical protein